MRTTLDLDDDLLRAAKHRATDDGSSLTRVLEDALRSYLSPATGQKKRFLFRPVTKKGRMRAGVELFDRDALYQRMAQP
jgi:hypothetical protein